MNLSEGSFEDIVHLWEKELVIPLLTNLKLAPGTAEYVELIRNSPLTSTYTEEHNPSGIPLYRPSYPAAISLMKCSHCQTTFCTREEQVIHYSLEWHQFNLKREIRGLRCVTKEDFQNGSWKDLEEDDTSSDDCSDEEESSDEEIVVRRQPRIFFVNSDNQVVSVYRTLLSDRKTKPSNELEMIQRITSAPQKLYWTIILVGGGHFAGGVFNGPDVVTHKTFHSYTVRAKQGGSQSSRDNKNATSHPRSAGASLRRYNEQAHNQHIQELMEEWKDHLAKCNLIFCRCPKSNQQLLFKGQTPFISKLDPRLRTIPFPSKKPTFAEVKRIHWKLSQILVHGNLDDIKAVNKEEKNKNLRSLSKEGSLSSTAKPPKKDESVAKKLTKDEIAIIDTQEVAGVSSSDSGTEELVTEFNTITTGFLEPYGCTDSRQKRKKRFNKAKVIPKTTDTITIDAKASEDSSPDMRRIENFVYTACRTGNLLELSSLFEFSTQRDLTDVPDILPHNVIDAVLAVEDEFNLFLTKFGVHKKTLLHIAAENSHKDLLWWLLENGCDPSLLNKLDETPYVAAKNKEIRNHFRRFMASFPDKYDYEKAKIPGPLTKEQEVQQRKKQIEKKKTQKKAKELKEKEILKVKNEKLKEEEEKKKFLSLSDREKRALAAEKRMTSQKSSSATVPSYQRCYNCAANISGIVPFEYYEFKFCSTGCVSVHRNKNKS